MIDLDRMSKKKPKKESKEKLPLDVTLNMLMKHRLYRKGEIYLFDISPSDITQNYTQKYLGQSGHSYVDACPEQKRFKKFKLKWLKLLTEFKGVKNIKGCIEFSKIGRLHLHINLTISKPLSLSSYLGYFVHVYGSKFQYKLDKVNDLPKRLLYLQKDEELFKEEFNESNLFEITKFGKHIEKSFNPETDFMYTKMLETAV